MQRFQDYTLREQEITRLEEETRLKAQTALVIKHRLPKRLRGKLVALVRKLQKRSRRCPYHMLLEHYCPPPLQQIKATLHVPQKQQASSNRCQKAGQGSHSMTEHQSRNKTLDRGNVFNDLKTTDNAEPTVGKSASIIDLATPHAQVSAFCRAVLSNLIPDEFWGLGGQGRNNRQVTMQNVDKFVRLRRFEAMSLHCCFQKIEVCHNTLGSFHLLREE